VLGSRDEQLMTSYLVGSTGSQVSLAWVVPELVVGRWTAAEAGDWGRARAVHDKLNAVAKALYRDAPDGKARVRLKACLKLLGGSHAMRCGRRSHRSCGPSFMRSSLRCTPPGMNGAGSRSDLGPEERIRRPRKMKMVAKRCADVVGAK
jgi:hypothetical protein